MSSNLCCPQYETLFTIQANSYQKSNISSQTLLRETRAKIPNKGTGKLQKKHRNRWITVTRYKDFRSFVNYFSEPDVNWGVHVWSNHRFIPLGTIWRMKVRGIWTYENPNLTWLLVATFVEVAVWFRALLTTQFSKLRFK